MTGEPLKTLWVTSMYGQKTRQPIVVLTMPAGETLQMQPEEAREIAGNILQAAEAAETDAFIYEHFKAVARLTDDQCAVLLNEFRKDREKRRAS